jgi:hypothetical protein
MINRFTPVNGATVSKVSWMHQTFGNWHHREIGCFNNGGSLELQVKIVESGLYQVSLEYDFPPAQAGNRNTLDNAPLPQPVTNATLSGLLEGGDQQLSLDFTCHNPSFFHTKQMGKIVLTQGFNKITLSGSGRFSPEIVSIILKKCK